MSKWKLYWVASDGIEDCFVVAKNSRSARRIEKDMNGFEDCDLVVTRIMDVPERYEKIANKKFQEWSKKNNCNTHLRSDSLTAWPYYAEDWLLEKLGIEYRTIEGERQILINDTVIAGERIYYIGVKAMEELDNLLQDKCIDYSNVSYEGMRKTIDSMLGACLTTIHRIEKYITDSFIFGVGNQRYKNYTIKEVTKLWKDKFTFGKLIQLIEESYKIDETVYMALQVFLVQRNKIAHGLTKDERYDIDTVWGQKELIGYLAFFLKNAYLLEEVAESAYIATMALGFHLMKDETIDQELLEDINDFEKDATVAEKLHFFTEVFQKKSV